MTTEPLRRLVATAPGVGHVLAVGETAPSFVAQASLASLPFLFGVRAETIPAPVPYLAAPGPAPHPALDANGPALKLGLAWAGNPGHANDLYRSCPVAALAPLMGLDGIVYFSLQTGAAAARPPDGGSIIDLAPALGDLADTAAAIARLDLVITVDTAVAHLAGALGRPVWLMLAVGSDWRWMLGRVDSPWYPSMRLFRQRRTRDWAPVIAALRAALRDLVLNS